jgi:hypothetical protein
VSLDDVLIRLLQVGLPLGAVQAKMRIEVGLAGKWVEGDCDREIRINKNLKIKARKGPAVAAVAAVERTKEIFITDADPSEEYINDDGEY